MMHYRRPLSVLLAIALVLVQIPLPALALAPTVTHNLIAGQHHVTGTVSAWHDHDTLYVRYDTNDDWQLEETHAWLTDTVPTSNPSPGSDAQDSGEYNPPVDSDTLELPLGAFGPGDCFYVLAHASVVQVPGHPVGDADVQETAWGGDREGETARWFLYFQYCIPDDSMTLGSITVLKLDQAEDPLAGAEFTLYKVVGHARQQVGTPQTTGSTGTVVFEDLEAGSYVVVETGIPFGYAADDDESSVIVLTLADNTVSSDSVTFTNTLAEDGQITVIKEDDEGEALDGATFTLYRLVNDDPVFVAGPQGTEGGQLVFEDLLPGTYRVIETTAPSGYVPAGGPQETTIVYNPQTQSVGTATLTFVNSPIQTDLGSITVRKWVSQGVRLYGATFALYLGDDELSEVTLTGTHEYTWPNLAAGTYRVVEVSAPEGFAKQAPAYQDVTLTFAEQTVSSATVNFYNSRTTTDIPASITVLKWDGEPEYEQYCIVSDEETEVGGDQPAAIATGPSLWNTPTDIANLRASGAEWIWESSLVQSPVDGDVVDFWRSFSIDGIPVGGTLMITADNGYKVSVNGTPVGSAQVYGDWESSDLTEAYVTSSNWQSVETYDVSGLLTPGSNMLHIRAANEYMGPIDGQANGTTTSNPGGVIFRLCLNVATGTLLNGAQFELSQGATVIRGPHTASGGWLTWPELQPGTYTITETTVPAGYTGGDPQTITVAAGENAVVEFVNERNPDGQIYGSITVNKLDADTGLPLAGATIEVRSGSTVVRTHTMTSGTYTFTGLDLGMYTVVETSAPDGYELADDSSETVTLTEGDPDAVVTFRNEPEKEKKETHGSITVRKFDASNDQPLAGATFEVRLDGETIRTYTMASGTFTFGSLDLDTYEVVETSAPAGYQLSADPSETVTLTKGNPDREVTFRNQPIPNIPTPPGAIEGVVTERGTGRVLPGATVRAFDSEGHPWGSPLLTDVNGYYLFTSVPAGTYSVSAFLVGYSHDVVNGVVVVSGETTRADLVLAKEETILVPPQPPEAPPTLPKTGVVLLDSTAVGMALLALGAIIKRRRYQAKH